jgi:exopolyphosphatase/guanosine-5'-triphosphate,3'-diphosphate pyrophosphatase
MIPSSQGSHAIVSAADLGTNTVKISHASVRPGGSIIELRESVNTIRLGKGIEETGRVEPERIEACLAFLKAEEQVGLVLGSDTFIGVATEALRVASNGEELLNRIREETSWKIRLISGDEEARLTYVGLKHHIPDGTNVTIVDVGGGSTEIVQIANDAVAASVSIPLGSGRLADRFFHDDPPGLQSLMDVSASARKQLDNVDILIDDGDTIFFSGGNGVFIQALVQQLFPHESLSPETIERLLLRFASTPAQDAADRLGIARERARVLPAGAAIAFAFLLRTRFTRVSAVPSGIRVGLIREFLNR